MRISKRIISALASFMIVFTVSIPVFADELVLLDGSESTSVQETQSSETAGELQEYNGANEGAELLEAAASVDLGAGVDAGIDAFTALYNKGVRVFDTAGIMDAAGRESVQRELESFIARYGQDALIVTADGTGGLSLDDFCDQLFYRSGAGTGAEKDGSVLALDMKERDAWIYGHGLAMRYLTDSAQDSLFDNYLIPGIGNDNYTNGILNYIRGLNDCYAAGIAQDQYNYDQETGISDPYYPPKKKSISPVQLLISVIAGALGGLAPVNSVKRKYAMQAEKSQAENFRLAYRAEAKFDFAGSGGRSDLINRYTTTRRIAPVRNSGGGSGFHGGGGKTTMHTGMGGSMHTGSGRKF